MRQFFSGVGSILLIGVALSAGDALSADSEDLFRCRELSEDAERLACFDAALAELDPATFAQPQADEPATSLSREAEDLANGAARQKPGFWGRLPVIGGLAGDEDEQAGRAEAPRTHESAPAERSAEAAFGAERLVSERAEKQEVEEIRVPIEEFAYNPYGKLILFLDNGQVWRQLSSDSRKLRLRKGKDYVAVIARGALGSYSLSVDGTNIQIKVTRLR